MNVSRKTILLIMAAIIAACAAISVRNRLQQAPAQTVAMSKQAPRILVAKTDMAVGSFVQGEQNLDWAPMPDNLPQPSNNVSAMPRSEIGMPPGMQTETGASHDNYLYEGSIKITDFNGAVVRRTLHTGDPVPQSALMKSGEGGFMSAVLENGMRAVSIAVNATSGNAGFVSPGDHIDLIVTHRVKASGGATGADEVVVSETFVHDVRVVAVDQMLDNPENKAILAKTITVEVTPKEAEQIAIGSEIGKISLALRSLPTPGTTAKSSADKKAENAPGLSTADTDNGKPEDPRATALKDLYGSDSENATGGITHIHDADLSQLSGHKSTLVPRVTVIRGDKSENIDFYQGKQ